MRFSTVQSELFRTYAAIKISVVVLKLHHCLAQLFREALYPNSFAEFNPSALFSQASADIFICIFIEFPCRNPICLPTGNTTETG